MNYDEAVADGRLTPKYRPGGATNKRCPMCGEDVPLDGWGWTFYKRQGFIYPRSKCIECSCKYGNRWYEENRKTYLEYRRQYYQENREANLEHQRQRQQDPEFQKIKRRINQRYKSKKKNLPYDWTDEDTDFMLDWWNNQCAFCGDDLNGYHHKEHWIAQSKGGPFLPSNILPCCGPKCNSSKGTKKPENWLRQQFGKKRAAEIIAKVEEYFGQVRKTEHDKS